MLIDPYKSVNKNVNVEKLSTKTDNIVWLIISIIIVAFAVIFSYYTPSFHGKNEHFS